MLSLFKKIFFINVNEESVPKSNKNKPFTDVINEWLEFHHVEIAESTYYGYKMMCSLLREYFDDVIICDIDTHSINVFILKMKRDGMTDTAIFNYCKMLGLCFDYAHKNGYIISNPVKGACVPKIPKHTEIYPFTVAEVMKLINLDYLQWVKDGVVIAFHTGMRMGEIYALKWTDIDFDHEFIMVQHAQSRAGSKVIIKATKTACGIRRIDIDKFLVTYLEKMKEQNASEFVFAPVERNSKYPFRVPWNLSKHIKKMCMMAGIPPRSFHTLRHTHATVLLAYGIHPKIVQERLGHSDIRITIMTYSHVLPTIQLEAVKAFERICNQFYNDDSSAVAVYDNIIELSQYGCYYTDGVIPTPIVVNI